MENRWLEFKPPSASNWAGPVDALFLVITALTILFTLIVGVMLIVFIKKFKRGVKADRSNPVNDHQKLELFWTITPLFLALGIFLWSTWLYLDMRQMPKHTYEVFVIGKQWMWHNQHPNGIRENNELTLPVGQPVKLTMISQDVIHAFYVPAFRSQYHVVPGRYTNMWFTPTKIGEYHLFCNVLCGTQHSEMIGKVRVLSPADFAAWLDKGGNRFKETPTSVAMKGKQLYDDMRCGTCHMTEDTERGPSLYGIFNSKRPLDNGTSVLADEDYLRDSIINPYNKINKGYKNTMPVYIYKKQVNEDQIRAMIEYMKTLGSAKAVATPGAPAPNTGTN
jgi:cytochrome c oxidase subunit II